MSKNKDHDTKPRQHMATRAVHHMTHNSYDRMVDRFFSDWPANSAKSVSHVRETDQAYVVSADIPGIPIEDIHVDISGNMLRVRADSEEEFGSESDFGGYQTSIRTFHQSYTLPTNVNIDQIKAHCDHGHLIITVPKAVNEKPRRIEVQSSKKKLDKH